MIHFEHELNEMVNRMLGGGLQSSILAAYQQELVEAKTLYEQCLGSFFGLPFISPPPAGHLELWSRLPPASDKIPWRFALAPGGRPGAAAPVRVTSGYPLGK